MSYDPVRGARGQLTLAPPVSALPDGEPQKEELLKYDELYVVDVVESV